MSSHNVYDSWYVNVTSPMSQCRARQQARKKSCDFQSQSGSRAVYQRCRPRLSLEFMVMGSQRVHAHLALRSEHVVGPASIACGANLPFRASPELHQPAPHQPVGQPQALHQPLGQPVALHQPVGQPGHRERLWASLWAPHQPRASLWHAISPGHHQPVGQPRAPHRLRPACGTPPPACCSV
jgi:hypothetical protein